MGGNKFIDVTLRFVDQFTKPMGKATEQLIRHAKQYEKAGKEIQRTGKSISNAGANLTKSVTTPLLAAGTAALTLAANFEQAMDKVASISGATGKELDTLTQKAKEMGAKTKFTASEAADAFSYMAMAGWRTQEMLDGIEGIMYLAGATGTDLAQTSDIVTDALTAFGLAAKDSSRMADVLAAAANTSNTNVEMLGESFKYVAPVAGAMGYSLEDTGVALGLMANSGIKASTAGTSLRNIMTNLAAPAKSAANAMKDLGLSLTDNKGNMKTFDTVMKDLRKSFDGLSDSQQAQYAKAIAGKQGMSGLLAIISASDSDFDALTESINNSSGAAQNMYDVANDNLKGALTILGSTMESIGISIGERLTPYIKQGTEWLQRMADSFNSLSDKQLDSILKFAGIAAAVGPAVFMFGKMVSMVGNTVSTIGKLGMGIKKAGGILKLITSPAGKVVLILGAIIAVGVLVVKNFDKIREATTKLGSFIKKSFAAAGVDTEKFGKVFTSVKEKINNIVKNLKPIVSGIIDFCRPVAEWFTNNLVPTMRDGIKVVIGILGKLAEQAAQIIDGLMSVFDGIITTISGVFTGNWEKAWDGVRTIFKGIVESLVGIIKSPLNAIISLVNKAISGINSLGISIPDWVPFIGGKSFSINIPQIPMLATGTENWRGGTAMVHDKGAEIIDLPRGSRVIPHDESLRIARQQGRRSATGNIVIAKLADQIIVREEADIDRIADRLAKKIKETADNMGDDDFGNAA